MRNILVLHGPNLNLLGTREPSIYGHTTLEQLNTELVELAQEHGFNLECKQSNHEGVLIDWIHAAAATVDYVIINPAGFTHTSVALRDALLATALPFIEVHITDPYEREEFRHFSFFSDIAEQVVYGAGINSYKIALQLVIGMFNQPVLRLVEKLDLAVTE